MALPGIDMFRLFIIRIYNGKNPFSPDMNHIHHLIQKHYSNNKTFIIIFSYILITTILYFFVDFKAAYLIIYILIYLLVIFSLTKKYKKLKRLLDIFISLVLLFLLFFPCLIISFFIILDSKGPIFYKTKRVGRNKKIFEMYKFRTMEIATPVINSNDLKEADKYITKVGKNLRKYSIDEIPQIINIILGDMSLVGPRPGLESQYDLIEKRDLYGINDIKPGVDWIGSNKWKG